MELSCSVLTHIADSSLEGWTLIGSGGFGQIYKARHRQWGCDVAIKLLHFDDGNSASLLREVDLMRQGSCPCVIQVRGVFRGRTPHSGPSILLGLVMEVMERGSLATLQERLQGALPWPLVFRLAHQVSLGINFLHTLTPPLLHLDLKPSNVLLDCDLNAKLTDFGLSRLYHSVSRVSKKSSEEEAGTISYMPPEAFHLSYSPTQASDIYSYGILLWSIITGKQPYAHAKSSLVRLRIPEGDRPPIDEIRRQAAGRAGLIRLMTLMERCWDTRPKERPAALACVLETEELYKMHKHSIHDAVHQVLKELDQPEEENMTEEFGKIHISQPSATHNKVYDHLSTARPPIQEMAGGWSANHRVKDSSSPSVCYGDTTRPLSGKVKRSSVHPIHSAPPSPQTGRSPQGRAANPAQQAQQAQQAPGPHQNHPLQRQSSSPDMFPQRSVQIHLSNVTGLQHGNNNIMHVQVMDRKRYPSAPSRVDLPPPHPANWTNGGGVR